MCSLYCNHEVYRAPRADLDAGIHQRAGQSSGHGVDHAGRERVKRLLVMSGRHHEVAAFHRGDFDLRGGHLRHDG